MGNYISFTRDDVIYSALIIGVWLMIRPYFVRLSEQAQARSQANLEAEAQANDIQMKSMEKSSSSSRGRKKKD
ncbi:hypothetical protein BCR41DRAFT_350900 [Lobosporangium transversale]|uniref:Uncharacterized protein n=1 Tax=Lobosporangium transversale TaxID=64571 RepID=A0A1Y2GS98_9FUNG|nr:hypothetical protein BCR41DRAFT_350900 [Lobosporangium transversale]ORZ21010.1 hypothetical protein BCR41DRAFT_350900 [Lobosporangium transversale]|eukprot:XP_021882919.1 hypothetical protein BCR41DRAFT_350900 [Lobosporangium transversale]